MTEQKDRLELRAAPIVTFNLDLSLHQGYLMKVQRDADHAHYLALIEPLIEEAIQKERRRILDYERKSIPAIRREAKKQERERMFKIFAGFGKIQLKKALSGKEFEALFD